ncbi:MAG: tetratricopeptide repeat protein [Nannocystaceae bacterium]|nr:tetratricopeptide repeat protein [Nannocystaceae bacterium]
MPPDRLAMLRELAAKHPGDPFPQYGLAMELRRRGELEPAEAAFAELAQRHPGYVPCYLMYGEMLSKQGRTADAAAVFDRGIAAAQAAGDGHALSELQSARAGLP